MLRFAIDPGPVLVLIMELSLFLMSNVVTAIVPTVFMLFLLTC